MGTETADRKRVAHALVLRLLQLYIPADAAHATVAELGELEAVQFRDLDPDTSPFSKTFISDLRRLDEMERRLRFLSDEIHDAGVAVRLAVFDIDALAKMLITQCTQIRPFEETRFILSQRAGPELLDELDPRLKQNEDRLRQLRENWDSIRFRALELDEARHVLLETGVFFKHAESNVSAIMDDAGRNSFDEGTAPLLENAMEQGVGDNSGFQGMDLE